MFKQKSNYKELKPFVSVIIPCFNGAHFVEEAVESVLSQTFTNLECIVVDDGSTDSTPEICQDLMRKDPRVQYILKDHSGLYPTKNFAIKHSKGEWIQFLDVDDLLHEDKIKFQLDYLKEPWSEKDVVLYSDYEVVWQDHKHNVVKRNNNVVGDLSKKKLLERTMAWSFKANIPLHINSTLFKKTIFSKYRFNEGFSAFGDQEFFVTLLLSPVSFIYTPITGMTYRWHQSNMTRDKTSIRYAYIHYLETLHHKDKTLLQLCPTMGQLIKEAMAERDRIRLDRVIALIDLTRAPVYFSKSKINIRLIFKIPCFSILLFSVVMTLDLLRYLKRALRRRLRFMSALSHLRK